MKTSKLLLVSVFIAVVILVVMGGAASAVLSDKPAVQDEIQAYQQREEEYQALIEQANQQIEQANADLQTLQDQLTVTQTQPENTPTSAVISPDEAAAVARQAAGEGQAESNTPELVNFEGRTAYEVPFDSGSIYVDAMSSEVLFNGTLPVTIDQEKAVEIAMEYFNEKDVVLADQITFRGEPLFRVVFRSRLMVYLDTTGQIQYAQYATLKSQANSSDDGDSHISDGGSGGGEDGEHEDEHESGEDH